MNTRKLMAKADALKKNKKNKKGFTLVELIVVLVILAILMAILIPTMSGYIKRANKTSDQSAAKTCYTAISAGITDLIGNNTTTDSFTDADNKIDILKAAKEYASAAELAKCDTLTFDGTALTGFVYHGAHFNVTVSITNGEASYTFATKSASSTTAASLS